MARTAGENLKDVTRRHFFKECGVGLGSISLSALLNDSLFAQENSANPLAPKKPHFAPKAKSVIFLFMAGAPSQVDLFDYKPDLNKFNGEPISEELVKGERFAFIQGRPKLLGSPHKFKKYGRSGAVVSSLLPHLTEVVDDLAFVRSMHTDQFNHAPAQIFMNTGYPLPERPSMGSWFTYGLGSESQNLPGFVVLVSGGGQPSGGKACWSSGFLPTVHQGVQFRSQGDPVLFVSNPEGVSDKARRRSLDTLNKLNRIRHKGVGDPEIATRIASYELAYRMQSSVPELMEISSEPKEIHQLYGTNPGKISFANNCLLARRLVERGVRFVQLYDRGWDSHGSSIKADIIFGLGKKCREMDQGATALIKDLKKRGLLDTTLVVWGGEFGRTPVNEDRNGATFLGRDHHPRAFTYWLAGGGIKPGITIGKTDDIGYNVVEDPVSVHDLHATILHLMGIEHTKLTYRFQGRDFRLTDVFGNVVKKLLA